MPTVDPFKATAAPNNGGLQPPTVAPPVTPPGSPTADKTATPAVDTNYMLKQGESIDAYNTRILNYNATKNAPPTSTPPSTTTSTPPPGWDATSYANFKAANPTLEPTAQDTAKMQNADSIGGTDANGNPLLSDQTDRVALAKAQADYQAQAAQVQTTITNIQNGTVPLTAGEQAQVDGLKQQFQALIDAQTLQNTGASGVANVRGYQTGAAEYDPSFQAKTIGSIVTAGQNKIADLNTKMASAVATLTQSFKDNDITAVKDAWSVYQDASKERTDALQKTVDDTTAAIKDAQAEADKQQAIQEQQRQDYYNQNVKPIQDIQATLAKSGAPKDVIASVGQAKTVDEALQAGGTYLQSSTNPDIAKYLFYQQQATAAGQTPLAYDAYQKKQQDLENSAAYSKAYATAAGTAAGQASAFPSTVTDSGGGLGGDSKGGSILAATKLSIGAYNFLTQGTASMSRMSATQRNQIMNEAQNWLNNNGVDISTFQSQYKAYNDVLQKNIQRANQTKIMAGEVTGSANSLIDAITAQGNNPSDPIPSVHIGEGMGNLRANNVLDLMLGKETNNKFAQTYSTQIRFMANDLAGYLAAARGASSPELQDQRDASDIISNGMNKGSIEAFKDAVQANEEKVGGVVNNAVTDAQKSVWGLFGVADQYASPTNSSDSMIQDQQQQSSAVDSYVKDHPDQAQNIANLYTNGFTDEQVAEYLQLGQ